MITQAQKARAEKYLNSLIRHNDKVMTVKEWLNLLKNEGYMPSIETVRDDSKEEKESECELKDFLTLSQKPLTII